MWEQCSVIIIDRNALALRPDIAGQAARLRMWVESGGRILIFPQHGLPDSQAQPFPEFRFEEDVTSPSDSVGMPDESLCVFPNPLTQSDWEHWSVSRSTDHIIPRAGLKTDLVAGTIDLRQAFILRAPSGRGYLTAVSLDFGHQLETLHTGACRIFTNLLSR